MMVLLKVLAEGPDLDWGMLVRTFGVPGAMMAVILFALSKGWLQFKGESDRRDKEAQARFDLLEARRIADCKLSEDRRIAEIHVWEERYTELKAESTDRITNLRLEKDMWRDTALKATTIAADAAKKVSV